VFWPKVKCVLVIWPVLQVTIPYYEQTRHYKLTLQSAPHSQSGVCRLPDPLSRSSSYEFDRASSAER